MFPCHQPLRLAQADITGADSSDETIEGHTKVVKSFGRGLCIDRRVYRQRAPVAHDTVAPCPHC